MNTWLSIDIGGTKISSAMIVNGEIIDFHQVETPKTMGEHKVIKNVLNDVMCKYKGLVDSCSIATAGIVRSGKVRAMSKDRLWGHEFFDLSHLVKSTLNVPTYIINDAQAAAYCEYIKGEHQHNMGYITVSTGVGGGLIINGNLLTGINGLAGHIGHTQSASIGVSQRCNCGRDNCVEALASGTAIAAAMKRITNQDVTAKEVFEKYRHGNLFAKKIIDASASVIANVIADLKIGLDIEHVVIGGSVGLAEGYVELVSDRLQSLPPIYKIPVTRAVCHHSSGLIGAYLWANDNKEISV